MEAVPVSELATVEAVLERIDRVGGSSPGMAAAVRICGMYASGMSESML